VKKAPEDEEGVEDAPAPKKSRAKAVKKEDDEEADAPAPRRGGRARKAAPKKAEEEDDEEEEVEGPKAKRGKKAAPANDGEAKLPQKKYVC
jgi:hypothetical protein